MKLALDDFCQDEGAAVTVDWVVLTAAIRLPRKVEEPSEQLQF